MTSTHPSQAEKAEAFRALHAAPGTFVIPNPWDVGTARLLEQLGFQALATTSAGFSFSHGRPDKSVPFEPLLAHLAEITAGTRLPVSADLENGFGDARRVHACGDGIAGSWYGGVFARSVEHEHAQRLVWCPALTHAAGE
jgi:2-methylisocitrate lyase-like PEP mutase family enzyme